MIERERERGRVLRAREKKGEVSTDEKDGRNFVTASKLLRSQIYFGLIASSSSAPAKETKRGGEVTTAGECSASIGQLRGRNIPRGVSLWRRGQVLHFHKRKALEQRLQVTVTLFFQHLYQNQRTFTIYMTHLHLHLHLHLHTLHVQEKWAQRYFMENLTSPEVLLSWMSEEREKGVRELSADNSHTFLDSYDGLAVLLLRPSASSRKTNTKRKKERKIDYRRYDLSFNFPFLPFPSLSFPFLSFPFPSFPFLSFPFPSLSGVN